MIVEEEDEQWSSVPQFDGDDEEDEEQGKERPDERIKQSDDDSDMLVTQTTHAPSPWLPLLLRLAGMFGMMVLNPLCCVLAMMYASPSMVAPFSGLTLVWILLWSGPCLREYPDSVQMRAAACIMVGEVLVAAFGDHTNDGSSRTFDDVVGT